jgi:hypothetical protein
MSLARRAVSQALWRGTMAHLGVHAGMHIHEDMSVSVEATFLPDGDVNTHTHTHTPPADGDVNESAAGRTLFDLQLVTEEISKVHARKHTSTGSSTHPHTHMLTRQSFKSTGAPPPTHTPSFLPPSVSPLLPPHTC